MTDNVDSFLEHYGVMGMRWGVRKDEGGSGISNRRTDREAAKDAKEYARAKMFYGEGAGTRRKLINKSVEAKSKKDPEYKKAFDYHVEKQDLSEHASKARSERHRKDAVNSTRRTARGVKNVLLGNPQYATIAAIAIGTAGSAAYKAGLHKKVARWGKTTYMKAAQGLRAKNIQKLYNAGKLF